MNQSSVIQTLIVGLILIAAVAFFVVKMVKKSKGDCGCGSGSSCKGCQENHCAFRKKMKDCDCYDNFCIFAHSF